MWVPKSKQKVNVAILQVSIFVFLFPAVNWPRSNYNNVFPPWHDDYGLYLIPTLSQTRSHLIKKEPQTYAATDWELNTYLLQHILCKHNISTVYRGKLGKQWKNGKAPSLWFLCIAIVLFHKHLDIFLDITAAFANCDHVLAVTLAARISARLFLRDLQTMSVCPVALRHRGGSEEHLRWSRSSSVCSCSLYLHALTV